MHIKMTRMSRLRLYMFNRHLLFVIGVFLGVSFYEFVAFPLIAAARRGGPSSFCSEGDSPRLLANLVEPIQRDGNGQPDIEIRASKRLFQGLPEANRTTFYAPCGKNCHPVIRAFRTLGWTKVDYLAAGRVIHTAEVDEWYANAYDGEESVDGWGNNTNSSTDDSGEIALSWQRYNHVANSSSWGLKENMLDGFARYRGNANHMDPYFLQETFRLHNERELQAFSSLVSEKGSGRKQSCKLSKEGEEDEGEKVVFPPNSKELDAALLVRSNSSRYIQKQLCEPLRWNDGNNLIVRVLWMVRSISKDAGIPLLIKSLPTHCRILSVYRLRPLTRCLFSTKMATLA